MEPDPVGQCPPERGDLGRARVGQRRGPGPPVGTVDLGDGAPCRPVLDVAAVAGQERVELCPAARSQRHRADQLERGQLSGPDRVPVDERRGAARGLQRGSQRLRPGPVRGTQPPIFRDVLDPQVERADLVAAHRQVRRRAHRRPRLGRVQRVDQHEVRAQVAAAPGGEVGQVVQVAVAPRGARANRVQLHGEAPGPAGRPGGPGAEGGWGERFPPRSGGIRGVAPRGNTAERREDRGQRLVRHLHEPAMPVLVGNRHPVGPCPAREFCACCHRTSLPERPPALTSF